MATLMEGADTRTITTAGARAGRSRGPGRTARSRAGATFVYIALGVYALQNLYPLVWTFLGSMKSSSEFISNIWGLPADPTFQSYAEAWELGGFGTKYANSILITGLALVIVLLLAIPFGYALARFDFRGKGIITAVLLAALVVPSQIFAIPLFKLTLALNIINNPTGVAIVYAAMGLPISIFLLRGFFLNLPKELEDAGYVDGLGVLGVLFRIMLPLARGGIALVVIFQFIDIWNEFFLGFLLLRTDDAQTLPLGLVNFFYDYSSLWPQYFAALIITTAPVLILFVVMQRQFIAGLTSGSVKG